MERLIDKIFNKVNRIDVNGDEIGDVNGDVINRVMNKIENIKKIKNVEIDDENDKKLFIYKNYGIQIKNGIKFKIIFFKIIDESNLEKLFELENIKIKISTPLFILYKYYEIWNYHLYDDNYKNILIYFCKKFNIKTVMIQKIGE